MLFRRKLNLTLYYNCFARRISLLILMLSFLQWSCVTSKNQSYRLIETNLGPYLYYYNGIQSRLYGDLNSAISYQKKSLELDSTNSAPYYELALTYGTLQDYTKAIEYCEKAVKIEPLNNFYRYYLGILYIQTNQFERALNNQLQLIKSDSTNISYLFNLALLNKDNGNISECIRILNDLSYKYGYNQQISDTRVKIFFEEEELEKADVEITNLIENHPEVPMYHLYKSELLFRYGEDSLAFKSLNTALELDPSNSYIKINKFIRFMERSYLSDAFDLLSIIYTDNLITTDEKVNLFYEFLFKQQYYSNNIEDLDKLVNILVTNFPEEIKVQSLTYDHSFNKKDFFEARKALSKILELDSNNPDTWNRVISFDFSFGNIESVIVQSQNAIVKFPNNANFYILKSVALDNMGQTDFAIKTLKDATSKIKSNNEGLSEIFGTLGDLYHKLNNTKSAFSSYKKGLKYFPDNARILNNYSYYLSLRKQNLSKALQMSTKAVDLDPNNSTYIDTKGWVLFQMGNYEEAKNVLRNAISKNGSSNGVINEHYADALFLSGNKESAYIYWLKAKEIGGGSDKLIQKIETKTYIP